MSNEETAIAAGLPPDLLTQRTGILERRLPAEGETVTGMAATAIRRACADAGLDPSELGHETVLLHVQAGHDDLVPASGVAVAGALGLGDVRVLGFDAGCAEVMAALDIALAFLESGRCQRVILSGAGDISDQIDPRDEDAAGLFGSGAAALVLSAPSLGGDECRVRALAWETHGGHADLGHTRRIATTQRRDGFTVEYGYYRMAGTAQLEAGSELLPPLLATVLDEAGWKLDDVDLAVMHQPSMRIREMMLRLCGLDPAVAPPHVRDLGNMGPANILSAFSLAREDGRMLPGTRMVVFGFGLGFTCGAAAIEIL